SASGCSAATCSPRTVRTRPGATAFTRIPFVAYCRAALFVRPDTPCFVATFPTGPGAPTRPVTEPLFTIEPPPRFNSSGIWYFMQSQTPVRFVATTRFQSSSVVSTIPATDPTRPALLNAQSRPPYSLTAFITRAWTSADLVTSARRYPASPPLALIAATVFSHPDTSMSPITTLAPSRAKANAVARPIPDAPPVTITTLPNRSGAVPVGATISSPPSADREANRDVVFRYYSRACY